VALKTPDKLSDLLGNVIVYPVDPLKSCVVLTVVSIPVNASSCKS